MGAQVATHSFTNGINMIGKSMTALFKGGLFALFIEGLYQIWRFLNIAASAGKELMHEREVEKARKEYEAAEKAYRTTGEDKDAEKTRKEYADWKKSVSSIGYSGDSKLIAEMEAKFQERLKLHGDSETLRTKMEQKKAALDALLAKGSGVDLEKLKNDWGGDYKSILLSTFEDFNIDEETKKTAKDVDEALSKELKNGKVYMKVSNDNRTTNIKQEVKLAADIQKVGILLNQNIRALIEKQMRQNREVALTSGL